MVPLVPLQYYSDYFLVTNNFSPLIVVLVPVFLMIIYPNADRFTPTRGDTCCIVSVFVGCYLGAWLNKQVGLMNVERIPSDGLLEIGWPTWTEFGLILLRTLLGLFCVALVEFVGKFFFFSIISFILRKNPKELKKSDDSLENKPKIIADLFTKFLTYTSIGIFVQFVVPLIFSEIGINRQAFYSEI
jgi:sphingosine-1-phosphate phosphatase 1